MKETVPCATTDRAVDCALTIWGDWTSCSKSCDLGHRSRHRHVHLHAAHGGRLCDDVLTELRACNEQPCEATSDCQVGLWQEWTSCDGGAIQKTRNRQIENPPSGGGRCSYHLKELGKCEGFQHAPTPCMISAWSVWTSCTASCGGGQQTRERRQVQQPENGGGCDLQPLKEIHPCNLNACDLSKKDCELGAWTAWSVCSATCGVGRMSRSREILREMQPGGMGCVGALKEVQSCTQFTCQSRDCKWRDWDEWSACTRECGGGSKTRNRVIQQSTLGSGAECAANSRTEIAPCNSDPCDNTKCIDGEWGDWSSDPCSVTCGEGVERTYRVKVRGNTPCGEPALGNMEVYKRCHLEACPGTVDCEFSDWSQWSVCSCACYGIHERSRRISRFPKNGGAACQGDINQKAACNPTIEEKKLGRTPAHCEQPEIPEDCRPGDWLAWSDCNKDCGGGQKQRHRFITANKHGGMPCESMNTSQVDQCNTQPCESICEDCKWDDWQSWSACSRCGEMKIRNRAIKQYANYCGKPCQESASREVQECDPQCGEQPMLYCAWGNWAVWGSCSGTCGNATRVRDRSLSLTKEKPTGTVFFTGHVGSLCAGTQTEIGTCELAPCQSHCVQIDCTFGGWSEWSKPNGESLCERHRVQNQSNNECGRPCDGPLTETKTCPLNCVEDCKWSAWTPWGPCASDLAQSSRSRSIEQEAKNGGSVCVGEAKETQPCSESISAPAINCQLSPWAAWVECTVSCGGGTQRRSRFIQIKSENGGEPCQGPLDMIQGCSAKSCPLGGAPRDCTLGEWTPWTQCAADSQQTRKRSVNASAQYGGQPCEGKLEETQGCRASPQDCQLSEWTAWGHCDKACDGGQQRRQRQVHRHPSLDGSPCPTVLLMTQPCNEQSCHPRQDCLLSQWSEWGSCFPSCGVAQRNRSKTISKEATVDGMGCQNQTEETQPCPNSPPCHHSEDCKWGEWTDWSGCTCDCGGGQRHRDRNIVQSPKGSGKLCDPQPKHEIAACNTQPCGQCTNAKWSEWGPWSSCSASCIGGMQQRRRSVEREADDCGEPLTGNMEEFIACQEDVPCSPDVDCVFHTWSEWSACSCTCDGTKRRTRGIKIHGRGNGTYCEANTAETSPCNPSPNEPAPAGCGNGDNPKKPCTLSEWTPWGICSETCGTGQHFRSRTVIQEAEGGGSLCEDALQETQQCISRDCPAVPPPVDCVWGEWSEWGACSKCKGQRSRFRTPSLARHGGEPCVAGAGRETAGCPLDMIQCHDVTSCTWGTWEDWGECTKTCGSGGERKRQRHLQVVPYDNTQRLFEENRDLERLNHDLANSRFQDIVVAFGGGAFSFVVVFAMVRTGRNMQADSSSLPPIVQDEQQGLIQAVEVE